MVVKRSSGKPPWGGSSGFLEWKKVVIHVNLLLFAITTLVDWQLREAEQPLTINNLLLLMVIGLNLIYVGGMDTF